MVLKIARQRASLAEFFDASGWRSVVALTLNLKQSVRSPLGGWVKVDEISAKKNLKQFMQRLNRKVYGGAYRHQKKRLRMFAVVERSERLHFHAAIEPPAHMNTEQFAELAEQIWLKTDLGYGNGNATANANAGWIGYMVKPKSKCNFEHYFDCIDTETYFNPVASV